MVGAQQREVSCNSSFQAYKRLALRRRSARGERAEACRRLNRQGAVASQDGQPPRRTCGSSDEKHHEQRGAGVLRARAQPQEAEGGRRARPDREADGAGGGAAQARQRWRRRLRSGQVLSCSVSGANRTSARSSTFARGIGPGPSFSRCWALGAAQEPTPALPPLVCPVSRSRALREGLAAAARSAYDCVVPARGKAVVRTGLAIAIPHGTYARIAPRSGLAVKHFVDTGAGVVDEDYRGEVGVVLFNHGERDFQGALTAAMRGGRRQS